jgi:hypothetical protein
MNTLADQLEAIVDKTSLSEVLEALAQVCCEKSNHLESNWQDKATAKEWLKVYDKLDSLAVTVSL